MQSVHCEVLTDSGHTKECEVQSNSGQSVQ